MVNQPYVVLEIDEPAQKFMTSRGLNMSPYWEETFELYVTRISISKNITSIFPIIFC